MIIVIIVAGRVNSVRYDIRFSLSPVSAPHSLWRVSHIRCRQQLSHQEHVHTPWSSSWFPAAQRDVELGSEPNPAVGLIKELDHENISFGARFGKLLCLNEKHHEVWA